MRPANASLAGGAVAAALVTTVFLASPAVAILPPGYEDEIYCPPDFCLQNKKVERGWTGPRSSFVECVHRQGNGEVREAIAWGENLGEESREKLLQDGFHTATCSELSGGVASEDPAAPSPRKDAAELGKTGGGELGVDPPPLELPAPGDIVAEEWSAGPQHWLAILAAMAGGWYYISRSGTGGGSRCAGGPPSADRPDAQDLRRRRLEALEKTAAAAAASATASVPSAAASTEAGGTTARAAGISAVAAVASAASGEKSVEQSVASVTPSSAKVPGKEIKLKGTLRGRSVSASVDGLSADSTVAWLLKQAHEKLKPGEDAKLRLFHTGKELKNLDASLSSVGVRAGAVVQVMLSAPAEAVASPSASNAEAAAPLSAALGGSIAGHAASSSSSSTPDMDPGPPFSVRAQGALPGQPSAVHTVEGLTKCTTTLELEGLVLAAFGGDEHVRMRLFCMGKEFKDPDETLGALRLAPGSVLQAMFSPGKGRGPPMPAPAGAAPTAQAAAQSLQADSQTADAVMAAAAAVGCAPGAIFQAPGAGEVASAAATADAAAAAGNGTREEAWRALAELQDQLHRATDPSEEPQARQAAALLKQMLTTVTHGGNPALLQFAQASVPDFAKIWAYEPTREHLQYILRSEAGDATAAAGVDGPN